MHKSIGVCLWFTGPSGAGKTTVTRELIPRLEAAGRTVTVLDVVPELAKHWAEPTSEGKLIRKAFVAREVVRHGGVAICVTVSARDSVRERARQLVGPDRFVEILVTAPRDVTERRRNARTNKPPFVKRVRRSVRRMLRTVRPRRRQFDGPTSTSADIILESVAASPAEHADTIVQLLVRRGDLDPLISDVVADDDGAGAGPDQSGGTPID